MSWQELSRAEILQPGMQSIQLPKSARQLSQKGLTGKHTDATKQYLCPHCMQLDWQSYSKQFGCLPSMMHVPLYKIYPSQQERQFPPSILQVLHCALIGTHRPFFLQQRVLHARQKLLIELVRQFGSSEENRGRHHMPNRQQPLVQLRQLPLVWLQVRHSLGTGSQMRVQRLRVYLDLQIAQEPLLGTRQASSFGSVGSETVASGASLTTCVWEVWEGSLQMHPPFDELEQPAIHQRQFSYAESYLRHPITTLLHLPLLGKQLREHLAQIRLTTKSHPTIEGAGAGVGVGEGVGVGVGMGMGVVVGVGVEAVGKLGLGRQRLEGERVQAAAHWMHLPLDRTMQLELKQMPSMLGTQLLFLHLAHLLKMGMAQLLSRQFP